MSKFTKRKTALIIGRWQPWHEGHRGLFLAALEPKIPPAMLATPPMMPTVTMLILVYFYYLYFRILYNWHK